MIPYRGIVAALGIATHDNVPKVVIISQGDSGKEPRDTHQEVPWEASNFFSRDVIEKARLKLIPFDQSRLRREIKETARQVLNRDFELYELRKFFATWMISQGVPESIVNTLQGRAPLSEFRVLVEHYWSPRHEELRQWYIKFAPRVCC